MNKNNPGQISSRFIVGIRVSSGMADITRDKMILLRLEVGENDGTIAPDIFLDATDPLPPDPPDPPPPEDTLFFGIHTRSGFGGVPLALPPASLITGTGAEDWVINAEGELAPSGTYGAVKTFSLSAGQSYTLTFSDASERTVTLVAAQAHFTASLTDTSAAFQLKTILQTVGVGTLSPTLVGRDCLINPTRAFWRIRPPAAGLGSAITIISENPTAGNDADGNPTRGGGCNIGCLAFDPSQLAIIPVTFESITFHNDVDGPHSTFLGYTSASGAGSAASRGVGAHRCRFINENNVSIANLNDGIQARGASVTECAFVHCETGVNGGLLMGEAATIVDDNVFSRMSSDAFKSIGQNWYFRDNHVYSFVNDVGSHPDACQNLGATTTTFTLPMVAERNTMVLDDGYWFQGLFLADTISPWWLSVNVSLVNNIFLVGLRGLTVTRATGAEVLRNLILRMPGATQSQGNSIFDLSTSTGATVNDNVSNTYSLGTNTGTNNVTLAAALAAYQTAMPGFPSDVNDPALKTRAAVIAACTPADLVIASGGFKKGDGSYSGPLDAAGEFQ